MLKFERKKMPSTTANHNVASLIKIVIPVDSTRPTPFKFKRNIIVASVPPRPPGKNVAAPTTIEKLKIKIHKKMSKFNPKYFISMKKAIDSLSQPITLKLSI